MGVLKKRANDAAVAELAASIASYALGVPQQDIVNDERGATSTAFARQVAMYLCHVGCGFSLQRVAAAFGRDRSTVAHACHAIEDRRDEGQFDLWIGALEAMMRKTPLSTRARQAGAKP
jgi:chromosomal replication initiation ATPase DnaA